MVMKLSLLATLVAAPAATAEPCGAAAWCSGDASCSLEQLPAALRGDAVFTVPYYSNSGDIFTGGPSTSPHLLDAEIALVVSHGGARCAPVSPRCPHTCTDTLLLQPSRTPVATSALASMLQRVKLRSIQTQCSSSRPGTLAVARARRRHRPSCFGQARHMPHSAATGVTAATRIRSVDGRATSRAVSLLLVPPSLSGPTQHLLSRSAILSVTDKVLDVLVERLLTATAFPNLRGVILWGDSAGGQVLARYSLTTHLATASIARLRIFPSNPSSFPYLDSRRYNYTFVSPTAAAADNATGAADGECVLGELRALDPHQLAACPDYDQWRYGIAGLLPPYVAAGLAREDGGVRRFPTMPVTYLQGDRDVCNEDGSCGTEPCASGGLDRGCEAMLQGPMRCALLPSMCAPAM